MQNIKGSADLHDHIDQHLASKPTDSETSKFVDDLNEHPDTDRSHMDKMANHLMTQLTPDSNWRVIGALENVLEHPKTDAKTVNNFLANANATEHAHSNVTLGKDALNKVGVDHSAVVNYLSKHIENGSSLDYAAHSDVLKGLSDKAKSIKDPEKAAEYDNFISRAYGHGPRDQSDHDQLKYVLKNALKDGGNVENLFDENKDISHNDLLEMYHQIPLSARKKLAAGDRYGQDNFLMDHPNIDKDYLASAALDSNHELHKNALRSKNLPTHVIDRLISDDNEESLKTAMEGRNLAPENADKLAEYGVGRSGIDDEYDTFLQNNADKLSKEAAAKVYSGLRGAGQDSHAKVLAQADNSSDEMFIDSLNRGEHPSLYGRNKITPELAQSLMAHPNYHAALMDSEDVPEEMKNKIAETLPYKDAIGYRGSKADKLPLSVQKTYFNQMSKKNKLNATLMTNIYDHEGASPEDRAQVLDAAVKGFKSKAKTPASSQFFAYNIAVGDSEAHEAFSKLKPEHQASVLNSFTDDKRGDRGEFLKKGDIDSATAKMWLSNEHLNEKSRDALLQNHNVDLHTYVSALSHNTDHDDSFSWGMNDKVKVAESKIDELPHAARQEFMDKYSNPEEFANAPSIVKSALLRHPDMNISKLPMDENLQNHIDNWLDSEHQTNLIKRFTPDQATDYFAAKDVDNLGHDRNWTEMHDAHPDQVTDFLTRAIGDGNRDFMYRFDAHNNVQELGHKLIDKSLENPQQNYRTAHTLGALYNPHQDPGHQRLINMLGAYRHDDELIHAMHEGLDSRKDKNGFELDRDFLFDKPDVLANIAPHFAPGGDMDSPVIWNKLVLRQNLPTSLKPLAALTDATVATNHLASIGHDQGNDAEKAEVMRLAQDPRTKPQVYDKLIEHMRVMYDGSEMDAGQYHNHAVELTNMIMHGMQNNKIGNDRVAMDALNEVVKDPSLSEEFRTKTAMDAVNMIQSQDMDDNWKSIQLGALANNKGLSEETRQQIGKNIIENAIASKDYKRLRSLGTAALVNDMRVWQNPEFKDAGQFKDFMKLANDEVIDWEMTGNAKHPEAWMHASKASVDYLSKNPYLLEEPWVNEQAGVLLFGGAENAATRPVAMAMITALSAKTSEVGGSVSKMMSRFNPDDSSYDEAMMSAFKGLRGSGRYPLDVDAAQSNILDQMRAQVTNEAQAASVIYSGNSDKQSAEDLFNYSHMVSEDGVLGDLIAEKVTENHPFLTQDHMNTIMNNLAEKCPRGFRIALAEDDADLFKSAKSLSAIAMAMPKFVDNIANMSTEQQDMHNMRSSAELMMSFSKNMFRVHQRHDLQDEGVKVARNHYVSNMIDGLTKMIGSPNISRNSATGIHREISEEIDGALPLEYELNKDQVAKMMNLSATIMAGQHTGSYYSETAVAAVNHGAFRAGNIDSADIHSILAENPAAVYSAVRNKNFTMDHMQHYRPDQIFAAWKVDPSRNQSLIDSTDRTNASFFGALADRAADFGDEDRVKILQKGLDYLQARQSALPVHRNDMAFEGPIANFAEKMVEATKGPTQGEMLLGHILANTVDPASYAVLTKGNLTANQNSVAIAHLMDMDGAQNLRKADEDEHSLGTMHLLQALDLDKDTIKKLRENTNISGIAAVESILDNNKISDKSIKPDMVNEAIKYFKGGTEHNLLRKKALKVRGIDRNQYDELTKGMDSATLFNPDSFRRDMSFLNADFGGDRFREMGVTQAMKDTFRELTGKKFTNDVEKFHHGKDLEAMNSLLGMVPPNGLAWKDFKRANPKLAENQKIKNLFMSNKEMVTPDLVVKGMSNLPGSYHITFGKWDGIQRHDDKRENLVIQFNLDKSFENHIAQDPELHQFMIDMEYMSNGGHPVAPRTMFWSRIDANSPQGWVIEEIQSDFDSTLRSIVTHAKDRGHYEINGNTYKTAQLEKFLKTFTKLLGDHVETAHSYIEHLAKQNGVPTLHMHGKTMRAELSGMDDYKEVPKWLEYKYETYPQKNGWEESDKSQYPSGKSKDKKLKTWKKNIA